MIRVFCINVNRNPRWISLENYKKYRKRWKLYMFFRQVKKSMEKSAVSL